MDRAQPNWTDLYGLAMHENDPASPAQTELLSRSLGDIGASCRVKSSAGRLL